MKEEEDEDYGEIIRKYEEENNQVRAFNNGEGEEAILNLEDEESSSHNSEYEIEILAE
jgi:hypothetical protein